MKKLILIAGVAALAACGDTATEEAAPAEEVVDDGMMEPAAAEEATAPDGGPVAGTYAMRDADGNEIGRITINDDMSFTRSYPEGEDAGTLTWGEDGGPCFNVEGAEPECYPPTPDDAVAEDGSWPMSGDSGGSIIRVEA